MKLSTFMNQSILMSDNLFLTVVATSDSVQLVYGSVMSFCSFFLFKKSRLACNFLLTFWWIVEDQLQVFLVHL